MRTIAILGSFVLIGLVASCAPSRVGMGFYASDDGVQSYYVDVSEYYGVPERDVVIIRDRRIPDEEIPVVFFIAQRAHVAPATICDMRLQGSSWMEISLHYGLDPDVYYVPTEGVASGPYGRAYGYYHERPRSEWKSIRLSDDDVVNFVNLRLVTEHYGTAAPEVMDMRSKGKSFVTIHREFRERKNGRDHDEGRGRH